jgi:hypothetical protein
MRTCILLTLLCLLSCGDKGPATPAATTLSYSFETGDEGWQAGFADYPAGLTSSDSLDLYKFAYGWSVLPASVQPRQYGIRLRAANRSDDVFMFLKKKVTGLVPDTDYRILLETELASNAPTNAIGIGGAPGEAVTVKLGATQNEPKTVRDAQQWYRMDIDKGNQTQAGKDMLVAGHIGVSDTTTTHAVIRRNSPAPLTRRSSPTGELWLIVGTDSGFEGTTELWWANIKVTLQR